MPKAPICHQSWRLPPATFCYAACSLIAAPRRCRKEQETNVTVPLIPELEMRQLCATLGHPRRSKVNGNAQWAAETAPFLATVFLRRKTMGMQRKQIAARYWKSST